MSDKKPPNYNNVYLPQQNDICTFEEVPIYKIIHSFNRTNLENAVNQCIKNNPYYKPLGAPFICNNGYWNQAMFMDAN